ncbi:MAG: ABC transporter substrate-binding protein, partial [Gemmatimonadales bacterium]
MRSAVYALAGLALAAGAASHAAWAQQKVLRYNFDVAETSADPHRVSDIYSNTVISAIFDSPLDYDYLARPLKLKPATLVAMPEVSADGKTFTMRVKPGIYFNVDPAFYGQKRELTAHDFVYSIKRLMDPRNASPLLSEIEGYLVDSEKVIAAARKANRFDYDAAYEGVKALDRYTWQIRMEKPNYTWIYNLADCRVTCAVAREVVEKYGEDVGSHPVGTGPYRMAFWKRSSKMVFERNPNFREEYFDGQPEPDDARGQEILR